MVGSSRRSVSPSRQRVSIRSASLAALPGWAVLLVDILLAVERRWGSGNGPRKRVEAAARFRAAR